MTCTQCGTLNEDSAKKCRRCGRPLVSLATQGKVPCYIHVNREATSHCAVSAKPICTQCTVNYNGLDYAAEYAPIEAQRSLPSEDFAAIPVIETSAAEVASFQSRLIAWVVDGSVIIAAILFVWLILELLSGAKDVLIDPTKEPVGYWFIHLFAFAAPLIYVAFMTAIDGQTLGKRTAGIMVLRPDGHPIDLQTSVIRAAMGFISLLPLGFGFLWALWDKDKETWHDKVAGTKVFRWSES